MRGPGAVERFANIDGVEIVALCDLYPECVDKSQEILAGHNLPAAAPYSGEEGWKELCRRDDIDLVYICTPWQLHVPMAVYAMEHGKHVAVEVPAAMSLDECWQLVDTAEKTQRHCMMLENCVYDFFELTTLNMAQHGLFGEILHTEGSYIHNL
ncbi:Gfo/Idh/MocA family oxidoreductase, partial [uncultured Haemophilus sp.]